MGDLAVPSLPEHPTFNEIRRFVHSFDPDMWAGSPEHLAGSLLISALVVGPEVEALKEFSRLSRRVVYDLHRRCTEARIFVDGYVCCDWFNENHGLIAFWLDVLVAQGLAVRTSSPIVERRGGIDLQAFSLVRAQMLPEMLAI